MCEECGCGEKASLVCPACGGRMVLIDSVPVCTACGARAPQAPHHHEHTHDGAHEDARPDDLARLRILLEHWVEHNEEHVHDLRSWAAKARALGQDGAAQLMDSAVAHLETCDQALVEALQSLAS